MAFRTKLDYSDNRQIKQFEKSHTVLSGGTSFGLTFSALTSGPNLETSGDTYSITVIASTFSGNNTTTIYNWYDPFMQVGYSSLSALTPSNSGTTQFAEGWTGTNTTIIDGNIVNLGYSGVTFDSTPISFYDLGGGNYSGTVETLELTTYSATSLDYTGRTIWVDVSGITRTERLIITDNPLIGYVWTCSDSEGMGAWTPVSGTTYANYLWVSGSSGTGSIRVNNGSGSDATNNYALAEGFGTIASGFASHAEGNGTIASSDSAHAEGQNTIASGQTSHAEGSGTIAGGQSSHAEGWLSIANGSTAHAQGYFTKASNFASHAGGRESIASGPVSFVHGSGSTAGGASTIVLGDGITGTTANTTYVERLNIKTLGVYSGNTAAISAGLEVGTVYRTSTGVLMITY